MGALVPALGGLDVDLRRPAFQHERPRQTRDVGAKRRTGQLLAIGAVADPNRSRIDLCLVRDVPTMTPASHLHHLLRKDPQVQQPDLAGHIARLRLLGHPAKAN